MSPADIANKTVEITAGDYTLKAGTSKITFDGFLRVYNDSEEEAPEADAKIPDLNEGDKVKCVKVEPKQHFTQPPPRYNEASLVKALEEYGIGRPSTYATIITVIQTRKYVEKKDKALHPTLLGRTVSKQLVNQFADIMDYKFTAGMETKLDEIAEKKAVWNDVLQEFYTPFIDEVNKALQTGERVRIETKVKCPNCGRPMLVRTSRKGTQFLGCSGYPECKTAMSLNAINESEELQNTEQEVCEEKCDKCGSDMVYKTGPYGKYMECVNPECGSRKAVIKTTGVTCPKCGQGEIVERKSKRGTIFYGCNKYPDCDFVMWNEPTGETCPDCGALLGKVVTKKGTTLKCSNAKCGFKKEVPTEENSE